MADKWPLANGNWSNAANWNGGTKPVAGDDVFADGFTVTIDENVNVASIRTTQRSGGTAGGGFTLGLGLNVTANIISGSSVCLTVANASGTNIVTGNVTGGTQGGANGAINKSSAGTLTVIGNVTGGSGSISIGVNTSGGIVNITGNCTAGAGGQSSGVRVTGTLGINIVGDCIGGSSSGSNGLNMQNPSGNTVVTGNAIGGTGFNAVGINFAASTAGTTTVNGNVTGNSTNAAGAGILLETTTSNPALVINGNVIASAANGINSTVANSGIITVNGNVTAAANAIGVVQTSLNGWIIINGNAFSASSGAVAFYGQRVLINSSGTLQHEYRVNNAGSPGVARSLYTGGVNLGNPATNNVRLGTVYGASNELTGTCAVPGAASVAVGVPVDNTVGTAAITPESIRAALGLASANLDTQLAGLASDIDNIEVDNAAIASAVRSELTPELELISDIDEKSLDIQSRIPSALDAGRMVSTVGAYQSGLAPPTAAAIADAVWDESLTGASHNNPTSAGRRLRSLADTVILKEGDTVAADNAGTIGGSNNLGRIQLQPDVGTVCVGQAIRVAGQVRFIEAYDAGTKYATVDNSWCTIPSPGDEYSIFSQRTSLIQKITSAAVGTIAYPIAKLWEMIEDVSGWRFKEKALEEVPASSVTITPLSSEVEQRVDGTNITVFLGENITIGPIVVTDSNGSAVDLSATCEIVISRKFRGDILVIPNSSITRSGVGNNQFTFPSTGATLIVGTHAWALRRVSDNFVYSYGDWIVKQAATKD